MEEISFEDIKRLQSGEKQVFNSVIRTYKNLVAGLCMKYMRNTQEAEDMAQEVFALAYGAIGKFQFKSKLSTWLYRMTVNHCINKLKSIKRRRQINPETGPLEDEEATSEIEAVADKARPADEELELRELKEVVLKELESFDEIERTLIILLDMEGLSVEEISEVLKMPVGSVKSKSARTRQKLAKKVQHRLRGKL